MGAERAESGENRFEGSINLLALPPPREDVYAIAVSVVAVVTPGKQVQSANGED